MKIKKIEFFLSVFFAFGFFLYVGIKNVAADGVCSGAGEACTPTVQDSTSSTGYRNPAGFDCTFRGVCPGGPSFACCKATAVSITPSTGSTSTPAGPTDFVNPLKFGTVEEFLGGILSAVQKIIVSLALVFIVIGAFLYITAGANPDNAENGKKAIVAAMIGLAIGIAAPSLLKELGNTIGWGGVDSSVVGGALGLSDIAIRVLNFLLGIMGILALIMLVIGAIMYLTSAGDDDRIKKGKEIFKYSLLGVLIAMASMVLVRQIAAFFATS